MQLPIVSEVPSLGGLKEVATLVTLQGKQKVRKQRQGERAGLGCLGELRLLLGSLYWDVVYNREK